MGDYLLRVPSILYELQKSESTEKATEMLTTLNEIISSSPEELEFLYKMDGFYAIMKYMKNDEKLANVCLKIFANASKKYEKIRVKLLKSDILTLMATHLQKETDFSKTNTILYAALIVILVQGNSEAQEKMRISGCLLSMIYVLSCILDGAENKELPTRNTELVIYAITACIKSPRNPDNQSEVGWITTKIVGYLGKYFPLNNNQLQLTKCFWSLLRSILDSHEANQQIFLKCSGLIVLYRSMQEVIDGKKCEEMGQLLTKMTGLLVKLQAQKEFLYLSANYCSIMILCDLINTSNILVIQHIIIFLNNLTREIHYSVHIMRDKHIMKAMKKAQIILYKSSTTADLCEDMWSRIGMFANGEALSQEEFFSSSENLNPDIASPEKGSLYNPQNNFCILHSPKPENETYSNCLFDCSNENEGIIKKFNHLNPHLSAGHFHRNELRGNKLLLKTKQNFLARSTRKNRKSNFNILKIFGRSLFQIFRRFWSYFFKTQYSNNYLNGAIKQHQAYLTSNDECEFLNNQLFHCQRNALPKNLEARVNLEN